MEASILIAKVLSIGFLSIGLGLLLNPKHYRLTMPHLLDNKTYLFVGGWIATSVGVLLVQFHNVWVNDWRLIVTIVSWLALIKGVMLLVFPTLIKSFMPLFSHKSQRNYILPMMIILGFIFGYFGFFAY